MDRSFDLERREFLRKGAITGVGLGLGVLAIPGPLAAAEPPRVRKKNVLGATGLEISDVSFGGSRLRDDPDLVRHALDRGINYFDTAESYTGSVSETAIGKGLKGKRDQVVIASKTHCGATTKRGELMRNLEASLGRLQTDRIEVYFNHAVNDLERLKNPEWFEFAEQAKKQGKIRFTGMSGHAGRLIECMNAAIDEKLVDVFLIAYNFGQDPAFYQRFMRDTDMVAIQPDLPSVLTRAKQKGIGVVAMKTLMGAKLNDMRPYEKGGATFAQAAFRWVLSNPNVDALIVSMTERDQIDEFLGASGATVALRGDLSLLARYAHASSDTYCRFGCGACLDACPSDVDVEGVLRSRMYAVGYGDVDLARREYALLANGAEACLSCANPGCAAACPHGLEVPTLARDAHRRIALA
jgi:uncharacterized protein